MKLAEALIERKSLVTKNDSLRGRIVQNARVQEGEVPAEQPAALLTQMNEVLAQLEELIQRINATNNVARLPDGRTLSQAIVQRDILKLRHQTLESLASQAAVRQDRYTRSEVKFVSTVDVQTVRSEADVTARAWRELDAQIQSINWSTDLVE